MCNSKYQFNKQKFAKTWLPHVVHASLNFRQLHHWQIRSSFAQAPSYHTLMPNKGLRKINHHQPSPGRSVHYPACQEWEWRGVTFQVTEVWEYLETRHLVFLMNNSSLNVHKPPSVGSLRPKSLPVIPAPVCPFASNACGNPAGVHLTPRLPKDHKLWFSWDVLSQHGHCRMQAEDGHLNIITIDAPKRKYTHTNQAAWRLWTENQLAQHVMGTSPLTVMVSTFI